MKLKLLFGGGCENLVENKSKHEVEVSPDTKTIHDLIKWIMLNMIKERPELFAIDEYKIRPGILVLINDVDWELHDTYKYELNEKDEIHFISTLHGG
ncbi:hypothetical protein SNEBB_009236 [Seison nebaliae]|nr:hypothetical protein SNEBB_009236 [Seison nebaliae]